MTLLELLDAQEKDFLKEAKTCRFTGDGNSEEYIAMANGIVRAKSIISVFLEENAVEDKDYGETVVQLEKITGKR